MNDTDFQASLACSRDLSTTAQVSVRWKQPRSLDDPKARFPGFHQRKVYYKQGQVVKKGYMPLPCDILMHESVPMKLSDGETLYSDIFLPAHFEDLEQERAEDMRVPALIAWSPYGKQVGTQILSDYPFHCGVPPSSVSSLQKWEGPDPAFWCQHNYAIVNVDVRGAYTSTGDAHIVGHHEAEDGAEFIEWLASQPWCNGKVGLSGNSWLAVAQWKIASLRPKGLAGIAPWEGMMDIFRDVICAGGIPDVGGVKLITSAFAGQGKLEDLAAGVERQGVKGVSDEYWEDKRSVIERVDVPVYCVASWTSIFHTNGTLRAFRLVPEGVPKWLRVHNTQEWPDYYSHQSTMDQKRFFDWCLRGQETGWEATPKVRLSVLNFGVGEIEDTVDRAESDWPLSRTKYTKYYLTTDKGLSIDPPSTSSELSYKNKTGNLQFEYIIPHDLETTGYPQAHLHVSCTPPCSTPADADLEIDLFVQIEKFTSQGWRQGTLVIRPKNGPQYRLLKFMHDWQVGMGSLGILYHWGSDGRMRASYAHDEDTTQTTAFEPVYAYKARKMLKAGEVREVVVPMRAYGMYWRQGDVLRFTISGKPVVPFALPGVEGPKIENEGVCVVSVGGKGGRSSCLTLPVV